MLTGKRSSLTFIAFVLCLSGSVFAQARVTYTVNCSLGVSLVTAVAFAVPNSTINITGTCAGPVTISTDGLILNAVGAAGITGGGKDAVTVNGVRRIGLTGLTITGGANGVVVQNGAQATLQNDTVANNTSSGIVVRGNSNVTLTGGSSQGNAIHGVDVEATSSLTVKGAYTVSGNGVFGININDGSSLTLTSANLIATQNTLGIQWGTNASGFLDGTSVLTANSNLSDGITIVSGSHVVDFGGTIQTNSNGIHGISLNSKAGLDLDAASQVTSSSNGQDGVHLEQASELSIFNNPNFSGNTGVSTVTAQNNAKGISLQNDSRLLDSNYAAIVAQNNTQTGLLVDDGSSVAFTQNIPVSGVQSVFTGNPRDLQLTFGARITTQGNILLGTYSCDATVLARGVLLLPCPH